MTTGGSVQTRVTPSLHVRRAPDYMPTPTKALGKATRDFDTYVAQAAALGAQNGYDLPRKAAKSGITTVEVTMSDAQVALLYPDSTHRKRVKGRATLYDVLRPFLVATLAGLAAVAYFKMYYVPDEPSLLVQLSHVVISLGYILGVGIMHIVLLVSFTIVFCVWTFAGMMFPGPNYVTRAVEVITGAVHGTAVTAEALAELLTIVNEYFWRVRDITCTLIHHNWVCPEQPPSVFQRGLVVVVQVAWYVAALIEIEVFWHSVLIFLVVYLVVNKLTQRRTIWRVRLQIETQAFEVVRRQVLRAGQEATTEKVAATPVLTHVLNHVEQTHTTMNSQLRTVYVAVCMVIASGWAANAVSVVHATEGESTEAAPIPDESSTETLGDVGAAKKILLTRTNTAPENVLRKSVRVVRKKWSQLFDEVQKGEDRDLPDADSVRERYCGIVTGPELVDITPGFTGGLIDEEAGVHRHLRQLKSTVTGEYLNRELEPDAEKRLEDATDAICDIVKSLAEQHYLELLNWSLPTKWGETTRNVYIEKVAWAARTLVSPILTGFVKTAELALPLSKLPRLVGSMGMTACAKDAATLASVESLFKKFMPHLVIKGLTTSGINARFASFARRARKYGCQLLSIDMSAMDSSWTVGDRNRVRRVMRTIVDELQRLLDAEMQDDLVTQKSKKGEMLQWVLRYITVMLDAEDAILFSGERGTSIGNRILMLIVWCAELLRVYGAEKGLERIKKMFFCPEDAYKSSTEDHPKAQDEHDEDEVEWPNCASYDCNIGDGDDCTLSIDPKMYASEREFILAYEQYHKLVEPCSAWAERNDLECLSTMCILGGKGRSEKYFFIPKVQRNFQRLLAHKVRIPPGQLFAEGQKTIVPTKSQYAEIATDLWQRSFTLRHSMVLRHLNRAMFDYVVDKLGNHGTVYSEDMKRLGKEDGDRMLSQCKVEVHENAHCDVSGYAMVKATHFKDIDDLSAADIRSLAHAWYDSDESWANLELTDELCARCDTLLTSFPLDPRVAASLGVKQQLLDLLNRQLVKGKSTPPEMSAGPSSDSDKDRVADSSEEAPGRCVSIFVYDEDKCICGFEPSGKPRAGMLTLPGGKVEPGETPLQAAVRELAEEAALDVNEEDLELVQLGTFKTKTKVYEVNQYRVPLSKTRDRRLETARGWVPKFHVDQLMYCMLRQAWQIEMVDPKQRSMSLNSVIERGIFKQAFIGDVLQRTTDVTEKSPGEKARRGVRFEDESSSQSAKPAFEVEGVLADDAPIGQSDHHDWHEHQCEQCGIWYGHSHPHSKSWPHKQRKGACPNVKCPYHQKAKSISAVDEGPFGLKGDNVHTHKCSDCGQCYVHCHENPLKEHPRGKLCPNKDCFGKVGGVVISPPGLDKSCPSKSDSVTSSDPAEVRQPQGSSPINGHGSSELAKSEGKDMRHNSADGIEPPVGVSDSDKSQAVKPESKQEPSAEGAKGNLHSPKQEALQTGEAATSPCSLPSGVWDALKVMASPTGPLIDVQTSRVSGGQKPETKPKQAKSSHSDQAASSSKGKGKASGKGATAKGDAKGKSADAKGKGKEVKGTARSRASGKQPPPSSQRW